MMTAVDHELNFKAKKNLAKISENIHIVANDPSLAFFRVQEHVRKVIQPITDKKSSVIQLQTNLQGHCYDMEYALSAVKGIESSNEIFKNVQDIIKSSIFLKQQLKYEEIKSKPKKESTRNSVYKRFSAHLNMDLPELLDFTGVMRETTQRGETVTEASRTENIQGNMSELQRSRTTLN